METEVDDGGPLSLGSRAPNRKPVKPVSYPAMQRGQQLFSALQEISIPHSHEHGVRVVPTVTNGLCAFHQLREDEPYWGGERLTSTHAPVAA